mmetsp:Transcript_6349/g.14059  ORF Transcript_6349/g.14059 Transcript_6349/m.14059 type:complete len:232 (+) Transcript_6349:96-791(+)
MRALLQTETLDSLDGGSWLAIGLVLGFVGGALITSLSCWFVNKRKTFSSDFSEVHHPTSQVPVYAPLQHKQDAVNALNTTKPASEVVAPQNGSSLVQQRNGQVVINVLAHEETLGAVAENPFLTPSTSIPTTHRPPVHHAPRHSRVASGLSIKEEYGEEDLDDDWRALLQDVDNMLVAGGASPMTAQERGIAIRRLTVSTGTRGPEFAIGAAREDVLKYRKFHGNTTRKQT